MLDSSYQGAKRLFALAYDKTEDNNQFSINSFKKYFLLRVKIENYNIEIDGRKFYDQPVKQYDEIRKISRWWLHIWLFVGFCLFWKKLQINCSWFEQTKSFKWWFTVNSTNCFHRLNKSSSKQYKNNNLLHSWTIKRSNTRICRNNKSVVTTY